MSSSAKIWISLLVGMAAGALAWTLPVFDTPGGLPWADPPAALFVGMFGVLLGLGLGLVGAWAADARVEKWLSLGLGVACGLAGALLGDALAAPISETISHTMHGLSEGAQHALLTLGQSSGWGVLGAVLGGGLGAARRSVRLAWQGALGGLVGGLLGGIAEEALSQVAATTYGDALHSAGSYARQAGGPAALGGLIGLGTSLVPWALRDSWVRVVRGGREHVLARPLVTLGQDRTCDVVLRGDPEVAPLHATIEAMPGGKHHLTIAAGAGRRFVPVTVNTRTVAGEQWLADGDELQVGDHTVLFRERATRGALRLGPAQPQAWKAARAGRGKPAPAPAPPPDAVPADAPSPAHLPDPAGAAPPPIPTLEPLPLLGLSRDMAMLSLSEDAGNGSAVLSSLPALLSGIVLRAEEGPYVGRAFVVNGTGVTRLGRAIEQEVPLPMDRTVSRLHARIMPDGDGYVLEDAGSANGTFANGLRLTGRRVLREGDVIRLGATVLRYS